MSTSNKILVMGFAGLTITIAFWQLIVMPYQRGFKMNACIDEKIYEVTTTDQLKTVLDVCEARTKYPSW